MPQVVLPVLNEVAALPWVLDRMPDGFEAIVIDNGSTDGSGQYAERLGARVVREERRGYGAACHAGLMAATADIVCFMDCDGSLDPASLPDVALPIRSGDADLVVGQRMPEPGAWPVHARIANRGLTAWLKYSYGVALCDLGPMRAARRHDLVSLDLRDRRFGYPLEMVTAAARAGWRFETCPVAYLKRVGRSKVTGTVRGALRTAQDMARVMR